MLRFIDSLSILASTGPEAFKFSVGPPALTLKHSSFLWATAASLTPLASWPAQPEWCNPPCPGPQAFKFVAILPALAPNFQIFLWGTAASLTPLAFWPGQPECCILPDLNLKLSSFSVSHSCFIALLASWPGQPGSCNLPCPGPQAFKLFCGPSCPGPQTFKFPVGHSCSA